MAQTDQQTDEHSGTTPPQVVSAAVEADTVPGPGARIVRPPMTKPAWLGASGFFDPTDPERDAEILLRRIVDHGKEEFELVRPIGYWHNEQGGIVVPADLSEFRTDLTSVPALFTWLIPKSGLHLPAALIHDGLVCAPGEPKTYVADHDISRSAADQIFRDGMRDLGTTTLRRWLMWTAVTIATLARSRRRAWYLAVMGLEIALISVLGVLATVDLFSDRALLPWMGHRPMWLEVLTGGTFAVIVPCALCWLWGRWWKAGIITGLALALLFHVMIAITVVSSLFQGAERAVQGKILSAVGWFALAFALLAAAVLVTIWATR